MGRGGKRIQETLAWSAQGGVDYCKACRQAETPCSKGKPGANGQRCPFVEHRPRTVEGQQALAVVNMCASQVRVSGMGEIVGLDMPAVFAMADALGVDRAVMAMFMPDCEQGVMRGVKRLSKDKAIGDH